MTTQTTQEAIFDILSEHGDDVRETYTSLAATGFAAFKKEVDLFVKESNSVMDDEDEFLELLDDEDMEELRQRVHAGEQERLDMYCDFKLFWNSADKQGSIPMGDYRSRGAAEAAIPGAKVELEAQCNEVNTVQSIRAGSWEIDRVPYI